MLKKAGKAASSWIRFAVALLSTSSSSWAADTDLPHCSGLGQPRLVLDKAGPIESIAFDLQGRLLYTDMLKNSLRRMDQPDAQPTTVATGIHAPGGIVVVSSKEVDVGTGNSLNGLLPRLGKAGIVRVDLKRGSVTPLASGLSMGNGLVRTQDGTFYASDDFVPSLDRVFPNGTLQRGWLRIRSNGLALSTDERTLYVNQSIPAKILAVDLATDEVSEVAKVPASRKWSFLDGLHRDPEDRLYIAAYFAGEVWRLGQDGKFCVVIDGLRLPSTVTTGRNGSGFKATSTYVATHSGKIYEIPAADEQ